MNRGRGALATAAAALALCLVLLLTPVSSQYADPCGSVLIPAKVWYQAEGELVHANTPPCRDARMERLPISVIVGVIGLGIGAVGIGMRRGAAGQEPEPGPARRSRRPGR